MPETLEIALIKSTPCTKYLNEYVFESFELSADKTEDYQQTSESEEIRVLLCEDLHSAEIKIDGKHSWKLVMEKGGESLIKKLSAVGVDLTKLDENGKTMLHVAVEQSNEPLVVLLHSLGINMEEKDSNGKTALDIANEGYMTSMQSLLQELLCIHTFTNESFRHQFLTLNLNLAILEDTGSRIMDSKFQSSGQNLINLLNVTLYVVFASHPLTFLLVSSVLKTIEIKPDGTTCKDKSFKQPSKNLSPSLFDHGISIT
ncbi:hypothetical protein ACLOAV_004565 [Pseudogymnoascus australis]